VARHAQGGRRRHARATLETARRTLGASLFAAVIALATLVAGCGDDSGNSSSAGGGGGKTVTLKFGHDSPTDHPYQVGAELFKREVEKRTEGRVKVKIFPNAQLGDEGTMLNGLKVGAVDLTFTSTQPVSESVKPIELFSLPFLFRDLDYALKVARGPIGQDIAKQVAPAVGGEVLGWGTLGERDMWNSKKAIRTPADVAGLKMRIQESKIQEATYKSFGALPTPVPFSELFTSLQTKVVDGADPGPVDIQALKFYQVADNLTITRHFLEIVPLIMSQRALDKLSAGDQKIVREVGARAVDAEVTALKAAQDKSLAFVKGKGMTVTDLTDAERQQFIDKAKPVYNEFASEVGGRKLIDEVLGG
jgi:tripartite ATP-independent transporter DctP family solute receptor